MRFGFATMLCVSLVCFAQSDLFAQGELSSSIDPFSDSDAVKRASFSRVEEPEDSSIFPKLKLPSLNHSSDPKRPSVWQKMNRNTKRFMAKSRETLMPWTKKERESVPITGLRRSEDEPKKKSFLAELLKPYPDEPKKIETANDWFSLPRPEY
jgi:hypothetical protein